MKDRLLCADCERRFNERGEKWVLARIPADYGEPCILQDDLIRETPVYREYGLALYEGAKIPAFDMDQLVYFAASIFWRGAVRDWDIDGERPPRLDLKEHQEPIRLFLLSQASFPKDVWLTTDISSHRPVLNGVIFPMPQNSPDWNSYWFYLSGVGFTLHFGSGVPEGTKHLCSQNTPQRIVKMESAFADRVRGLVRDIARKGSSEQIHDMLKEIEKIRGKGVVARKPPAP